MTLRRGKCCQHGWGLCLTDEMQELRVLKFERYMVWRMQDHMYKTLCAPDR